MSDKDKLEQQIRELTLELEEIYKKERTHRVNSIKEKLDSGNYILVINISNSNNISHKSKKWAIVDDFNSKEFIENKDFNFKFIHKKDEDILRSYITNNTTKIEYKDKSSETFKNMGLDFIKSYSEKYTYRLKKLEWYEKESNIGKAIINKFGFICIFNKSNFYSGYASSESGSTSPLSYWKPATKEDLFKLLMEDI